MTQYNINLAWAERNLSSCKKLTKDSTNVEWRMCSPLRENDKSPSFNVNLEKGCFRDWGDGDDKRGTLSELAALLGVDPPRYAGNSDSSQSSGVTGQPPKDNNSRLKLEDVNQIWLTAITSQEKLREAKYIREKGLSDCDGLNLRRLPVGGPDIKLKGYRDSSGNSVEIHLWGQVVVPIYNATSQKLQGVEIIENEPREGKFHKRNYGEKLNGCWITGNRDKIAPIVFCEGMATAATIALLRSDLCAVCCFGLDNIEPVAKSIHLKAPLRRLLFAADTGDKAKELFAQITGQGLVKKARGRPRNDAPKLDTSEPIPIEPLIPPDVINGDKQPENTDWNDIYIRYGSDIAKREIDIPFKIADILHDIRSFAEVETVKQIPYYDYIKRFDTEEDLSHAEFAPRIWPIEGLIPLGLSMLGGYAKKGKSWLALQGARAVAQGAPFLGLNTHKMNVYYYALEDTPSRINDRLQGLNHVQPQAPDLHVTYRCAPLSYNSPELQALIELMLRNSPAWCIFDTWAKVKPNDFRNADAYTRDSKLYGILKIIADSTGGAITVITHLKKGANYLQEEQERFTGSLGQVGSVDGYLLLDNPDGLMRGNYTTISRNGKDFTDTEPFYIEWCSPGWTMVSTEAVEDQEEIKKLTQLPEDAIRILLAIDEDIYTIWTAAKIKERLSEDVIDHEQVSANLKKLVSNGMIKSVGRGKYQSKETIQIDFEAMKANAEKKRQREAAEHGTEEQNENQEESSPDTDTYDQGELF